MEDKKILTQEEVLERAKEHELSDEDLEKINGGTGSLGWAWTPVYAIKTWTYEYQVNFIFNYGDTLKLWEFFGGGEEGRVIDRKAIYSPEDGGWIDKYLVDTGDDTNWWCKRDVIVYPD